MKTGKNLLSLLASALLLILLLGTDKIGEPQAYASAEALCREDSTSPAIFAENKQGDFVLRVISARAVYPADTAPDIRAELCYAGSGTVVLGHTFSPLLFFEKELSREGSLIKVVDQPLFTTTLASGQAYHETYRKVGGIMEDSPNREFYEAFYGKPEFPAGTYEIKVQADFNLDGGKGERYTFSVPLTVEFR